MGYPSSVLAVQEGFESRRQGLLELAASKDMGDTDTYGRVALVRLSMGRDLAAANEHLRWAAQWYDHPHPTGRDHRGEVDFTALRLARALVQYTDRLEPATLADIRRFFLTTSCESMYASENHALQFHAARLVAAQAMPQERFEAYGTTGHELVATDTDWITRFIRFRARQGWGEFDSSGYLAVDMESLLTVAEFAADQHLARMAKDMCDLLLADIAVDSIDGVLAGALGRSYGPTLTDVTSSAAYGMLHLYFGTGRLASIRHFHPVECLLSSYRPHPLVIDIATNRDAPYVNRERKHLHRCTDPLPAVEGSGSIRKQTWWEPQFAIGAVQRQDSYGPDSPDAWYARHQQVEWQLVIPGDPPVTVFTHHPGKTGEHMYWCGDNRCECGSFVQNGPAVAAVYRIKPKMPFQHIHAHLPRERFDEIVEHGGWLFVRRGDVYAGLWAHNGWRWADKGDFVGREVISEGWTNAVVCEVGTRQQGTFQAFQQQLLGAVIRFDPKAVSLEYASLRHGRLRVDADGGRYVDGQPLDLEYPTWDSPYMRSAWDSGLVELTKGDQRLVLDFRN